MPALKPMWRDLCTLAGGRDLESRAVIGLNEGSWGLLDGMNDAGLAACLTFGGRPV